MINLSASINRQFELCKIKSRLSQLESQLPSPTQAYAVGRQFGNTTRTVRLQRLLLEIADIRQQLKLLTEQDKSL